MSEVGQTDNWNSEFILSKNWQYIKVQITGESDAYSQNNNKSFLSRVGIYQVLETWVRSIIKDKIGCNIYVRTYCDSL